MALLRVSRLCEEQVFDAIRKAGEYLGYKELKGLQIEVAM